MNKGTIDLTHEQWHFRLPKNSIMQIIKLRLDITLDFAMKSAEKLGGIGTVFGFFMFFVDVRSLNTIRFFVGFWERNTL